MPEGKPFPLNSWYAATWSHEVKHELAARTICEKDVVLYRRSDGAAVALEDACWHRLLPLSLGRLKGDDVVCGYHGLVFNSAGRCTYMPAQKTINPSAAVRAYPTIERHQLLWIWPGDPALADPAKMPDFYWNDGTDWVGEGGTFYNLGATTGWSSTTSWILPMRLTCMSAALVTRRLLARRSKSRIPTTLRR